MRLGRGRPPTLVSFYRSGYSQDFGVNCKNDQCEIYTCGEGHYLQLAVSQVHTYEEHTVFVLSTGMECSRSSVGCPTIWLLVGVVWDHGNDCITRRGVNKYASEVLTSSKENRDTRKV